jgi:hypothetical protein
MIYSARATGHVLLTSTNAGHVLYISLGQLPGNPWGITPSDGDPRMHRELDAHFRHRNTSSLTYASDGFLRHRFIQLVRAHPAAWLHKDLLDAKSTLTGGFYDGEFIQQDDCRPDCWTRYGYSSDGTAVIRSRLSVLFGSGLRAGERLRFALLEASALEGRVLSLVGYLLGFVLFGLGLRRRDPVLALVALVAVFQAAMNTLTYYLPSYSSNVILFSIVFVGIAFGVRRDPRASNRAVGDG